METPTATKQLPCFKLKASSYTLTSIQLLDIDLTYFQKELKEKIEQAPKFFDNIPVVIDLQIIADKHVKIDFHWIKKQCLELRLIPIGVRGGFPYHHTAALDAGLAMFPETKVQETKSTRTEASVATLNNKTKVIRQIIRSGQQIYAPGGDLIVIGTVSTGAEILADGNIHVYGPLRGRALAGVQGDKNANIFCQSLEAELVSIAGFYWVSETLKDKHWQERANIYLTNEDLHISPL